MARISYAEKSAIPERLQNLFDDMSTYGPFGSLVGAMARVAWTVPMYGLAT